MTLSPNQHQTQLIVAASSYASVLTLYTYDYLLNLSREVELMWPGPFHLATVLYFSTRYLPFVKLLYDIATVFLSARTVPSKACAIGLHVVDAFHILSRTAITVVLFVQTYAVYNQSKIILATLGPMGVALIILDGIESAAKSCVLVDPSDRALHTSVSLVILTAFPTAVMLLTFYRMYAILRHQNGFRTEGMTKKGGLTTLILYKTLCMSGVCVLRLFNTLWFILGPTEANLGVNPFTLPVAAVFISHFLLSLRGAKEPEDGEDHPADGSSSNGIALTTLPIPIWIDPPAFELVVSPPPREEPHDEFGQGFGRSAVERWTAEFRKE